MISFLLVVVQESSVSNLGWLDRDALGRLRTCRTSKKPPYWQYENQSSDSFPAFVATSAFVVVVNGGGDGGG